MAGFSPFIKSLAMVILAVFFIIGFATVFIQNTNPSSDVFESKYGFSSSAVLMNNTIQSYTSTVNTAKNVLNDSKPSALDYVFLIFLGAFSIPLSFLVFLVNGIYNLGAVIFGMALGSAGDGIFSGLSGIVVLVSGVVMTSLVVTVIFLIIKVIRSGESER